MTKSHPWYPTGTFADVTGFPTPKGNPIALAFTFTTFFIVGRLKDTLHQEIDNSEYGGKKEDTNQAHNLIFIKQVSAHSRYGKHG